MKYLSIIMLSFFFMLTGFPKNECLNKQETIDVEQVMNAPGPRDGYLKVYKDQYGWWRLMATNESDVCLSITVNIKFADSGEIIQVTETIAAGASNVEMFKSKDKFDMIVSSKKVKEVSSAWCN